MVIRSSLHDDDNTATVIRRPDSSLRQPIPEIAHYIIVLEGSETGKKLDLGLKPIRIGRNQDNDLALADPFVSGHHCTVSFESGVVWVNDHGSTNGTFINAERIVGRAKWPDSASLQIGNQILCHEYRARDEMERSTQLKNELRQAAEYVRSLLPHLLNAGPVTTDWHYAPSAELGGDIFNYYWLTGSSLAFYLIDVCGHGIGAALHSVSVSNLLRQGFLPGVDFARPGQVLEALNRALPMEKYGSMYFTLWYGVYDVQSRTLSYASAGHPPAILFSSRGRRLADLATDNPPIGVLEPAKFHEASVMPEPASILYLYSDGVFEITDKSGDIWDWASFAGFLERKVQAGAGQAEGIYRAIREFTREDLFDDDFSLMRMDFEA